jgi:hypothetical protein
MLLAARTALCALIVVVIQEALDDEKVQVHFEARIFFRDAHGRGR